MSYSNLANSDHPATILYLVDISGSMNAPMPDGKKRIEVAKDAIQTTYTSMISRSLRQGQIHPRYRVGMIAYTDELYDVYGQKGSILSIKEIKDEGVPPITPQKWTNMAKAFRYASQLLNEDIKKWPQIWIDKCPPPMVINLTDCEVTEETEDPVKFAREVMQISIPDGNVLVENIFITDQVSLQNTTVADWQGYKPDESTGDKYGDNLLAMSSLLPNSYAQTMREQAGLKIRDGSLMMFPGISAEFIKTGFVMSIVSGAQVKPGQRKLYDEPKPGN